MKKKLLVLLVICMTACLSSGCAIKAPTICVTMYPIRYLVEKIAGDKVNVVTIGDNRIAIRSQIASDWKAKLESADLFLYLGQVEPYLQIYLSEIRAMDDLDIIDLATTTSLYAFQRYTNIQVGESSVTVESPYYEGSIFNSIDTYNNDPYVWLDPVAMTSMARQIRDWLNTNYPEESEYFNEQYTSLETALAQLDSQYQLLRKNNSTTIRVATMSPSFGTWQKNYGIEIYPVILSRYGVLPTEDQLAVIEQRIVDDQVNYICYESNMTEDMIELYNRVKEDLNLQEISMSNLASITDTQVSENKDYIQIMYENLAMLESIGY